MNARRDERFPQTTRPRVVARPVSCDLTILLQRNRLNVSLGSLCLAAALFVSAATAEAQYARPRMQVAQGQGAISLDSYGVPKGNASAPVWIVELADFGCGYCAKFARETLAVR